MLLYDGTNYYMYILYKKKDLDTLCTYNMGNIKGQSLSICSISEIKNAVHVIKSSSATL